ncbi:hypothetical protein [Actinacidiphila bryophytorum]|uniref:Uncharacterized protein n=1 Tax=Actinacidiphila bryophytorum TaxID=1436133 RepID=A0A9W4EC87_9ACTN|nr:hypothetical protein [Actinacidiphila bryophytorum]MBM9440080.1 hypothetical protein [Actinacidiphila bryophytorum]MBN6543946.1 hypothetical protein [Actinacidiphila bryophytorum]CAG7603000.1 hypothetical protein SBRY_10580 [Actinacidiphila bryophytorum]
MTGGSGLRGVEVRFVLPPATTLSAAAGVLSRVARLGSRMAAHPRRPRPTALSEAAVTFPS